MFNKPNKELQHLNDELLAEEEDYLEEEYEEELDLEDIDELLDEEDFDEEDFEEDLEELLEEAPVYRNHANRYGKGSPKIFDYAEYEEDDLEDGDFLYKDDYRKAEKKKKRGNLGLIILAILELTAIAAIILWWASWIW